MSLSEGSIKELESRLDDFDYQVRKESLLTLNELVESGDLHFESEQEVANLHAHTFFSYNAYGYSPTHLAWLGKKSGVKYFGIVDFDILDGVDEFLESCESIGLRGSASMETRVHIPQFSTREINSPGEPGVAYHLGIGFTSSSAPFEASTQFEDIRRRAAQRNRQVLEKVNSFLNPLEIDYEREILPLTPSGNATERHMVYKILQKSLEKFNDPALFWSEKFHQPKEKIQDLMANPESFQTEIRRRLIKRGGVGYIQPTVDSFPLMDEFHQVVEACLAIPCAAWLDGTSSGEQVIEELLAIMIKKGVAAINLAPERNWMFADKQEKKIKMDNLHHLVDLAKRLDLPVIIGTEMNSYGQKLVDDFFAPELMPFHKVFMDGASFIYGHTWMQKRWGMGYQSQWAAKQLVGRRVRNDFFIQAGRLLPPSITNPAILNLINQNQTPEQVLASLVQIKE